MTRTKIKTQGELGGIIRKAKEEKKTVGFTNGCFDILHLGHVRYLEKAKQACDVLVVGVNSDESVRKLKGEGRPINGEDTRMEILAAVECVDFLTLFAEDTPEKLIKSLTPHVLFKGGDWEEGSVAGAPHVKSHGGEVRIIPYVEGYSTSEIIEKIKNEK